MHRIAWLFTGGLLAVFIAGASSPPAPAAAGNTAVIGFDQEPPCLNPLVRACNVEATRLAGGVALAGAFRQLPNGTYEPELVDDVEIQSQPFTLTYRIEQDAVWNDGTPVSADDFLFTLEMVRANWDTVVAVPGYDLIVEATRLDEKTVRFRFSESFPSWKTLFADVLPKHALAGHDLDRVLLNGIVDPATQAPIGSGPYLVPSWTPGSPLSMIRNPRWWGARGPVLDALQLRFILDVNARFQALTLGEVELLAPPPTFHVGVLQSNPDIAVRSALGTAIQHLDFNVGSTTMPLLREAWFRHAVAAAIDRDAIAAASHSVIGIHVPAQQHLSYTSGQPEYVPSFARHRYDPAAVAATMTSHGCTLGTEGIWSCGGVRASVKVSTTTGNSTLLQAQQQMQDQARAAGIELIPDNASGGVLFGVRLPARQYELIMFAWVLSPGDTASGAVAKYGCGGGSNFMDYCSPAVTQLLADADHELDPTRRAQLVNDADRLLAEDVATLPLFLRPNLIVHRRSLSGPAVNPFGGPMWNVEGWHFGPADTTAPTTAAQATPAATAHGWNDGTVTVELRADDGAGSGIHAVRYSLSGAQSGSASVPGNAATVTVTADGVTTLTYFARDRFGNVESLRTLTIRIDRVAPTVACAAAPATLWPPSRKLVPVQVDVDVSDGLSGVDGFTLVSLAGGEAGDVDGFDVGAPDTAGSLRAERSQGQERRYVLTYEGADRAGNTARCAAEVAVRRDG